MSVTGRRREDPGAGGETLGTQTRHLIIMTSHMASQMALF